MAKPAAATAEADALVAAAGHGEAPAAPAAPCPSIQDLDERTLQGIFVEAGIASELSVKLDVGKLRAAANVVHKRILAHSPYD